MACFLVSARDVSLFHIVHTSLGPTQTATQ